MSWKKNVFLWSWSQCPEKERIFSLLQEKAWKRTYYLCLKRKRIFCKSSQNFYPIEENVHPNETKPLCKRKPEWKCIFCAWKENVFFCKSRQNFTPIKENVHPKETKYSLKKNVFFVPERKTYFSAKASKSSPQLGRIFTQRKPSTLGDHIRYLVRKSST